MTPAEMRALRLPEYEAMAAVLREAVKREAEAARRG